MDEHLINQSADVLGYYAKDSGLNLRKEPNAKSDIIGSVRGELFEIKLTHQTSGQWCKVKITKHKEYPCETALNEKENTEINQKAG